MIKVRLVYYLKGELRQIDFKPEADRLSRVFQVFFVCVLIALKCVQRGNNVQKDV